MCSGKETSVGSFKQRAEQVDSKAVGKAQAILVGVATTAEFLGEVVIAATANVVQCKSSTLE
ncbi:hypothetical protein CPHO_12110 [Corynebacterium phocae]|uniref:Uncharacterized protein n=1 Tax=Corynebacterium phocae TaxID=161895 RepID=A0A1L7D645_9CORY|nr:hypothetical protein CPHO_12110 [Corynebacterium phocae]